MSSSSSPPYDLGVIHGRFQVLHRDHLKYLLAGRRLCRHLVVGITNPDPTRSRPERADPDRSRPAANPLTYFERYTLLRTALEEVGERMTDVSVVPLPISFPELYRYYVPLDGVFFLTIYDDWGRRKAAYFRDLGLRTHVLWEVPRSEKGISGNEVRERMRRGEPWRELVPESTAMLLEAWGIPERLREPAPR